jgi:uncharacterized protein (DUF885 family)
MLARFCFAVCSALAAFAACAAEPAPNKTLNALFEREFQRDLAEHPESATFLGVNKYNDRLSDFSPPAVARRKAHVKAVIAELGRFDAGRLSTQDRLSREIFLYNLKRREAFNRLYGDLPFGADRFDSWMPVSPMFGPHMALAELAKAAPFREVRDYDNYLKRLDAVPHMLDQLKARMEAGIRSGWVPPRAAMEKVPAQYAAFSTKDVTATPMFAPFRQYPAAIVEEDRARLTEAARKILAGGVHPAFAQFRQFLESIFLPACSDQLPAAALPGGKAYYALKVRESTTTSLTPEEIHDMGKREVSRIRAEMDKVIASTGFKGSFADFLKFLKTDARFYVTSADDMLMRYRDIAKRADAELPKLFAELPRLPYGIRAMEAYEGDNAEHYSGGALDGSRAGFFEANTNNFARRPTYDMEALLLHEAVPGHHLQTARAHELKGVPAFRRASWYVAYGEGWALYAESLGDEMGLYRDPYSRFGKLSAEIFRASRLVVDTGLHAFDWTRGQAVRYLADNSGIDEKFAEAEIDRYIVWPGQALGYKIGELKIKELRAKARQALGPKFDVRRFHNAILDDGALPLDLLEVRIDEWIARERR